MRCAIPNFYPFRSVMLKNLSTTRSYDEFLGEDLEFELEISHNQKEVEDKVKNVGVEENVAGSGEKGRDVNAPTCGESDDTSNESHSGGAPLQRVSFLFAQSFLMVLIGSRTKQHSTFR